MDVRPNFEDSALGLPPAVLASVSPHPCLCRGGSELLVKLLDGLVNLAHEGLELACGGVVHWVPELEEGHGALRVENVLCRRLEAADGAVDCRW